MSKLLTPRQTADELAGMSVDKVYRLIRSGELPAIKIGGRIYIATAILDRWLADLPPLIDPQPNVAILDIRAYHKASG